MCETKSSVCLVERGIQISSMTPAAPFQLQIVNSYNQAQFCVSSQTGISAGSVKGHEESMCNADP